MSRARLLRRRRNLAIQKAVLAILGVMLVFVLQYTPDPVVRFGVFILGLAIVVIAVFRIGDCVTSQNDDAPDLRLELRKGWSIKPWQLAVVIVVGIITYFLVNFLNNTLSSKLMDNPNLVVLVIVSVLFTVGIIILYAIRKLSEKAKD